MEKRSEGGGMPERCLNGRHDGTFPNIDFPLSSSSSGFPRVCFEGRKVRRLLV